MLHRSPRIVARKITNAMASWFLLGLVTCVSPAFAADAAADVLRRAAAVDALMSRHTKPDAPGAAVGVYRAGRVIYAKGFGVADLETGTPITTRTPFYISSVSKQFTAFAIALLAHEGKLDLDADIRRYLPWFPDLGHTITTRHLVHHTSGLREQYELVMLSGRDLHDLVTQPQMLKLIARQRALNFAPGTDFQYNNTSYTLLAEIVHAVSGQGLRQFTTERMFAPLGMTHTFFMDDCCEVVPGRAHHYDKQADGSWKRMRGYGGLVGSSGLLTTVEDLAHWAGNFSHPEVGGAALIEQVARSGKLNDGSPLHYGFGLFDVPQGGRPAISHLGVDLNVMSYFVYYPQHDVGIAVLGNSDVEVTNVAMAIADIYLPPAKVSTHKAPATLPQPDPAMLERMAGVYVAPGRPALILEHPGGALGMRQSGDSQGQKLTLRRDGGFDLGKRPGEFYRPLTVAGNAVVGFDRIPAVGAPMRYTRAPTLRRDPAALAKLAGTYHSDEIDTSYTFTVDEGQLVASSLWRREPIRLVQISATQFDSPEAGLRRPGTPGTFTFELDADGEARLVRMSSARVRGLELVRVRGRTE